jgi:hypothetical protein
LNFIEDPKYNPRAAEFTKMVGVSTASVTVSDFIQMNGSAAASEGP